MHVAEVLSRYPIDDFVSCTPLGNAGGFSGAALWRVETRDEHYCLRRWPTSARPSHLKFIHRVLGHVSRHGHGATAVPLRSRAGETITTCGHALYELSRWMPGEASYRTSPNELKLANAMTMLAQFHVAAATCPQHLQHAGTSDGICHRRELIRDFGKVVEEIEHRLRTMMTSELHSRANVILDRFKANSSALDDRLRSTEQCVVPLQPCIRDVWHDHVLYTGDEVTGLVDFGAMRIESVAADLSRLVGSLVSADEQWQTAMNAYEQTRPLSDHERQLVGHFADSFRALAGMQWLQWLVIDGREFEQPRRVISRLDSIIEATCPSM